MNQSRGLMFTLSCSRSLVMNLLHQESRGLKYLLALTRFASLLKFPRVKGPLVELEITFCRRDECL